MTSLPCSLAWLSSPVRPASTSRYALRRRLSMNVSISLPRYVDGVRRITEPVPDTSASWRRDVYRRRKGPAENVPKPAGIVVRKAGVRTLIRPRHPLPRPQNLAGCIGILSGARAISSSRRSAKAAAQPYGCLRGKWRATVILSLLDGGSDSYPSGTCQMPCAGL